MPGRKQDDPKLSLAQATSRINGIAMDPAAKVALTKHAFSRQTQRVITYPQCIQALQLGTVTERRRKIRNGRVTHLYAMEFTDEFGPIRVVTRIKGDKLLLVITNIDLGPKL